MKKKKKLRKIKRRVKKTLKRPKLKKRKKQENTGEKQSSGPHLRRMTERLFSPIVKSKKLVHTTHQHVTVLVLAVACRRREP